METRELFRLAFNSLRANKLRSALTTLGIIIGVFSVILLVALGSGLQKYITDQISGLGSNLIFITPGDQTGPAAVSNKLLIQDARSLTTKLRSIAEVGPLVQQIATVKYNNKSSNKVSVSGTTANYPDIIKTEIDAGTFFTPAQERSGGRVALIGKTVQDRLFGSTNPIGKKVTIGNGRYTVIGTIAKQGSVFGQDQDNAVIIPITIAQRQFGLTNVNAIYLSSKKTEYVELVKKQATDTLTKRLTSDDFQIQSQEETLETVNNITNILTIALGGIAAISLLVGGIGVMNIMLVSVTERTKEIGLRKALGARRRDILLQFLLEAVMLSLVGGTVGIILGFGISVIVSQFFVAEVTPWSIFLAFGFSVAVGIIFGMAPAIRASRLSPIEALRYE